MMRYAINYQLNTPGKKYKKLHSKLQSMGAQRTSIKSQWVIERSNSSAKKIKETLRKRIDKNDCLLVICLDDLDWAEVNLGIDLDDL